MKTPLIEKLNIPELMSAASHLALDGKLAISDNNLVYLDVDDAYIHRLFPLLHNQQIKKPDYFGKKLAGAHITVIYPEENTKINKNDLDQKHDFILKNLVVAQLGLKKYYVLLVESFSLLELRKKYQLPDLLCFKGYTIGFHITIGVEILLCE
jgi:hypothetical protein